MGAALSYWLSLQLAWGVQLSELVLVENPFTQVSHKRSEVAVGEAETNWPARHVRTLLQIVWSSPSWNWAMPSQAVQLVDRLAVATSPLGHTWQSPVLSLKVPELQS